MLEYVFKLRDLFISDSPSIVSSHPLLFEVSDIVPREADFPRQIFIQKLENNKVKAP